MITEKFDLGDVIYLTKQDDLGGVRQMIGLIVKVYPDKKDGDSYYVRSLNDNFECSSMSGHASYDLPDDKGYYLSNLRNLLTYQKCDLVKSNKRVLCTKITKERDRDSKTFYEKTTIITVESPLISGPVKSCTYVYLNKRDCGGFAAGNSQESVELAGYRAKLNYLNRVVNQKERVR